MGEGMICVQVAPPRGKWHALAHNPMKTACNEPVPFDSPRRALELVDSGERCLSDKCREARARARGLTT